MELALWIIGILAALLALLCRVRVGVRVTLTGRAAEVEARVGLLHLQVYHGKSRQEPQKPPETAKQPAEPSQKGKPTLPRFTAKDLREAAQALWPPLRRALGRTRRGIRVQPLTVSVTLGGAADPAETAQVYGLLHAGIWTVMPVLEELLDIRDPGIHLGLDFDAPETEARGCVGVSIRIGTLLAVALGVGIPALRWLSAFQKRKKTAEPTQAAA